MNCPCLIGESISRSESHRSRSLVQQYELVYMDRSEPRQYSMRRAFGIVGDLECQVSALAG